MAFQASAINPKSAVALGGILSDGRERLKTRWLTKEPMKRPAAMLRTQKNPVRVFVLFVSMPPPQFN